MNRMETYVERFKDLSFKNKKMIIDEINYYVVAFEEFKVEEDWDDFLSHFKPSDLIRMTVNGVVNPNDTYLRFSSDGNLESLNETEFESELNYHANEIITELINNIDEIETKSNYEILAKIFEGGEDDC